MTSNRFIYSILAAFIAGNLLIIFMQYNSTKNIHNLITGNKKLLNELNAGNQLRELERDLLSAEIKMDRAVATADTSRLGEVDGQLKEARDLLDSVRAIASDDGAMHNIQRLSDLAAEKSIIKAKILDSFRRNGGLSMESFRAITRRRPLSNEVNTASRSIYESRQRLLDSLSTFTSNSGRQVQRWNLVMIFMVLVSGAVLFWYIISRIRQQNQLIQQLDASERKVREVSLVKENFMAKISHEIRTPMNAVIGFTNLLKARNRDPELAEFVEAIGESGENLLILINDLLDVSKIAAGMMRIESVPFSVRELLSSVHTLFAEKMDQKGLHFSMVVGDSVPDLLSGDTVRLTQILANMIGNAVKFTEEGSIRLEVNNKEMDGDLVRLGFIIRDTGIGIAPEKLPTVFDQFRQAEDSITRKYGGTGLGLSIVKDLVLLQHGEIAVESEVGKGTTFRFTIPYQLSAAQPVRQASPKETGIDYPDSRHIRILVAEDNKMNQSLLRHLLTGWRLSFDIVDSGIAAVEKLQTGTYDLVLMDVQMPGMDGYEATRQIRMELKLDTPVIAMTAHAFAGEREKSLNNGMNEYIAKPIDERELFRLIARFTGMEGGRMEGGRMGGERMGGDRPEGRKELNNEDPAGYQFIDLQYMRGISEGDKEYERTVTEQFLEVIPLDVDMLESALAGGDQAGIRHTAHSMRSDIAIMGLLEKLQSYLDVLEYEPFDQIHFQEIISGVKAICLEALPEVRHFYDSF
ncbi:MAG TPA: ATP-binding protein [Puia sp.]|nr:ATP-binding protein [Puia sp.]